MQELTGKKVEVTTGDVVYIGVLIEIGEASIELETQSGWVSVPIDKVADVKLADPR
ncbi:hypothetical protein BMS3Abin10_02310 [bacterium BMS3Abin10]|nr:hypothetical protein BMS3Abin10_02310 [bacterium BMS3Abin10]GBE38562.1 hypothetical protein BMS3Bbin08_01169 [bacterium BMS3Bbin08]